MIISDTMKDSSSLKFWLTNFFVIMTAPAYKMLKLVQGAFLIWCQKGFKMIDVSERDCFGLRLRFNI